MSSNLNLNESNVQVAPGQSVRTFKVTHDQFTAAALNEAIDLYTPGKGELPLFATMETLEAFAGPSITALTLELRNGSNALQTSKHDAFTADTLTSLPVGAKDNGLQGDDATPLKLRAVATGANLNTTNSGEVLIKIFSINVLGASA